MKELQECHSCIRASRLCDEMISHALNMLDQHDYFKCFQNQAETCIEDHLALSNMFRESQLKLIYFMLSTESKKNTKYIYIFFI